MVSFARLEFLGSANDKAFKSHSSDCDCHISHAVSAGAVQYFSDPRVIWTRTYLLSKHFLLDHSFQQLLGDLHQARQYLRNHY
jgi:hypothetical protein